MKMREKTLKVYRQPSVEKSYPEIRLSGRWLMKNGFRIGDFVRIAYRENVILIRRIDNIYEPEERH